MNLVTGSIKVYRIAIFGHAPPGTNAWPKVQPVPSPL